MTPLVYLVLAWLAGVWAAAHLPLAPLGWLAAAVLAAVGAALTWRRPNLRLPAACLIVLTLAGLRLTLAQPPRGDPAAPATYIGQGTLALEGVVSGEVDRRQTSSRLRVRVERVTLRGGQVVPLRGEVLVLAERYSLERQSAAGNAEFQYGDRVRILGALHEPPTFDSFDYRLFLASRGLHAIVPEPSAVKFIAAGQGNPLWAALLALKARGLHVLGGSFTEPHASLLAGILLGVEAGIPTHLDEAFQVTGTSHIVAISGFNFAILIGLVGMAARRGLGPRRGLWLTLAVIVFYTLLVGAGASVVRAAIMGALALLAGRLGRRAHALNGLAFAAWLMTLLNPLTLWDAGFQLSAAATLGLVLYTDRLSAGFTRLAERVTTPGRARALTALAAELILITFAAQLTTLPLLLVLFRQLSLASLLANALIVPIQPAVMVSGGVALLLGLVWPALGQVAAWLAWPFTAYTIAVVEALARLPLAALHLGQVSPALAALLYAALFAATAWPRSAPAAQQPAAHPHRALLGGLLVLGSAALVLWSWFLSLPPDDGHLRLTVLDLSAPAEVRGGGEAVLVQTPGGQTILIGGGPGDLTLARGLDRTLPLFTRRLDLLVIAARGDEHLGALPAAVQRFQFQRALVTGAPASSTAYRVLMDRLAAQRVEVISARGLPALDLGDGLTLRVLADDDDGSVLRLEWQRFALLLAPGRSAASAAELASRGLAQPATALLLARGGAASGFSPAWLQAANPHVVLAAVSAGQPGALPAEVVARLEGRALLRTDLHGDIRLETDGIQLWVTTTR